MKFFLLVIFLGLSSYIFGQTKYVNSKNPLSITGPSSTKSGDYRVKVSLNPGDSSSGYKYDDFTYLPMDVVLVINAQVIQTKISPTSSDKASATYILDEEAFGLSQPLGRNWNVIAYTINYKLGNDIQSTSTTYYGNPDMTGEDYFTIQQFNIIQPKGEAMFKIKSNQSDVKISKVVIKDSPEKNAKTIASCSNVMSDGGGFYGMLINNTQNGRSLVTDNDYWVSISFSRGNNALQEKGYTAKVRTIQDFSVSEVESKDVYHHIDGEVVITFTSIPRVAKIKLDDLEREIDGIKISDTKYKFPIPSASESFTFGTHTLRVFGEDVIGTPLSGSNKQYNFTKLRPEVESLEITSGEESIVNIELKFTKPLAASVKPNLVFNTSKGIYALPMAAQENALYNYKFKWSDETIKNYFATSDKKASIYVQVGNSLKVSSNFVIPVQIISKAELEAAVSSASSKSKKREKVSNYLSEKGFNGDIESISASIVDELSKDKQDRSWGKIWSSVVKLAPKVIGALTLLI